MNCPESLDLLQQRLDGTAPGGASPDPNAALEHHLSQCTDCRQRHVAARRLLDGLRISARPLPSEDLTVRIVTAALRDRQRRRTRVRRSLAVTAGLAAAILLMLLAGYLHRPAPGDPSAVTPIAKSPEPRPELMPDAIKPKQEPPPSLAALSGKLADKTLDQALVLWTAANPVEGMPVADLPNVSDAGAAEPLRQAQQEVSEGLQAVSRSARRAIDYFSPMLDLPQGN
jgi:Putative zinc-finger